MESRYRGHGWMDNFHNAPEISGAVQMLHRELDRNVLVGGVELGDMK